MTMRITNRQVRDLSAATVLLDWATQEGWNPGQEDAKTFFAADPGGWWLAHARDGSPVGGLSLVHAQDSGFAFLGLYIVRSEWRGKGVGYGIWKDAIAASPARCIGLDGVPAEQANYARSGFVLAFPSQRFRFTAQALSDLTPRPDAVVVPAQDLPFEAIARLDRQAAYPAKRDHFLRRWIAPSSGAALGLVRNGDLCGFGVIRACHNGHKIGPLIANSRDDACILLRALGNAVQVQEGFIDIPHPNLQALALASDLGLEAVFETARMYRGDAPAPLDLSRLWGITTFELG